MNKFFVGILALGLFCTMFAGCANANHKKPASDTIQGGEYMRISAEEAKQMMVENNHVIILDVRTPEEYEAKHIPGAVLVPNETITNQEIVGLGKEDTILVYCRSGNRSRQAAEKLIAMGYQHVYDFGGINTWQYETEAGAYQAK